MMFPTLVNGLLDFCGANGSVYSDLTSFAVNSASALVFLASSVIYCDIRYNACYP